MLAPSASAVRATPMPFRATSPAPEPAPVQAPARGAGPMLPSHPSAPTGPDSAAGDAYRTWAPAFLSIPGAVMSGYASDVPNLVTTQFTNVDLAHLADNVFVDAVNGVRLVMKVVDPPAGGGTPAPAPAPAAWTDDPGNVVRMAGALPGVVETFRDPLGRIWLATDTKERADWLRPVVNDHFGDLQVLVHWIEELPRLAPGATPFH